MKNTPGICGPLSLEQEESVRAYYALSPEQRREIEGLPERIVDAPDSYDDEDEGMEVIGYVAAALSGVVMALLLVMFVL